PATDGGQFAGRSERHRGRCRAALRLTRGLGCNHLVPWTSRIGGPCAEYEVDEIVVGRWFKGVEIYRAVVLRVRTCGITDEILCRNARKAVFGPNVVSEISNEHEQRVYRIGWEGQPGASWARIVASWHETEAWIVGASPSAEVDDIVVVAVVVDAGTGVDAM